MREPGPRAVSMAGWLKAEVVTKMPLRAFLRLSAP